MPPRSIAIQIGPDLSATGTTTSMFITPAIFVMTISAFLISLFICACCSGRSNKERPAELATPATDSLEETGGVQQKHTSGSGSDQTQSGISPPPEVILEGHPKSGNGSGSHSAEENGTEKGVHAPSFTLMSGVKGETSGGVRCLKALRTSDPAKMPSLHLTTYPNPNQQTKTSKHCAKRAQRRPATVHAKPGKQKTATRA